MSSHQSAEKFVLEQTDQCVKCGLCIPQCPTYNATFNENESPRGRIALIQGVFNKQLSVDDKLLKHLDQCLLCQRCERLCPSGVKYGRLMDTAKQLLKPYITTPKLKAFSLKLLSRPKQLNTLGRAVRVYQKTGLASLVKHTPGLASTRLAQLSGYLPATNTYIKLKSHYPAQGEHRGRVLLFSGCMGQPADSETISSSIKLLTALGYEVQLPEQQVCCGALHQHNGDAQQAQQLASQNLDCFIDHDNNDIAAIIYTSSGCGSQLKNYVDMDWADKQKQAANHFNQKLMDIHAFLAQTDWPEHLQFKPLNKSVTIHQPCSQRNALRLPNHAATLLAKIPQLEIKNLPDTSACCGAAGDYMLRYPQQARTLRQQLLEQMQLQDDDIIATTNIGCSLFIKAGIDKARIRLLNPVTLLAEQLQQ